MSPTDETRMPVSAADVLTILGMPVSGTLGGWLVYRISKRRNAIEARRVAVEAAQVEVTASDSDRARIAHLEKRVDDLEEDRENDRDYIGVLKGHIWDGKPPPPPARPKRSGGTS